MIKLTIGFVLGVVAFATIVGADPDVAATVIDLSHTAVDSTVRFVKGLLG